MGVVRAQVEFDHDSALPKDRVVNTFHFATVGAPSPASEVEIVTALQEFYAPVAAPAGRIVDSFSQALSGTWRIKLYDLAEPEPRAPMSIATPAVFAPGVAPLPEELALCLSYKATIQSGDNPARMRGRVYVGPLGASALVAATGRPTQAVIDKLVEAGDRLATRGTNDAQWCVYSPTSLPIVTDFDQPPHVTGGWVDNAWDVQRRRGLAATARTTWAA